MKGVDIIDPDNFPFNLEIPPIAISEIKCRINYLHGN